MFVETGRLTNPEPSPLTLDGGTTLTSGSDYAAIMCLRDQIGEQPIIVAELSGGAYNIPYVSGRVASLTGNAVVLGWANHERQWRGSTYDAAAGSREQDLQQLYTDLRWDIVAPIVQKYKIDYIFYGSSERIEYGSAGEEKFREVLEPVCDQQGSVFYRVTDGALQVALE
jgi:uncharacterized membrane protein